MTGNYKGYIFDIYYDWSTYVRSRFYRAIIFNVYFKPPLKSNRDVDEKILEDIAKRNHFSNWSMKNWNYWWKNDVLIMRNGVGLINPGFEKILKRMDLAVTILDNENLKPVDRATLESWRKQDPNSCVPEIITYFEKN